MTIFYDVAVVAASPTVSGAPNFVELDQVKWSSLKWGRKIGEPGDCTVEAPADNLSTTVKGVLVDLMANALELWVRRTDTTNLLDTNRTGIVHAGPITACKLVDRKVQLTSIGLLGWLDYWPQMTDATFAAVDQATIVKSLLDTYQAQTYANRGLDTTALASATGVVRDLVLKGGEGRNIGQVCQDMGTRSNGFDMTVDPNTRRVRLWSPRKGSDLTGGVILDTRSIADTEVSWSAAPGVAATDVLATASSSSGSSFTSRTTATSLTTFGRAGIVAAFQDVAAQATLDDHAARLASDLGVQHFTLSPKLLPVTGFGVGDFDIGDVLLYDFDAGLGRQTQSVRLLSFDVDVSNGLEMISVGVL